MSAPVRTDDNPSMFPTMYAPPWAREAPRDVPGDAGMAAVEKALNASDEFRRTLPAAAPLERSESKRGRRDKPFEGDIAVRHLRERASLNPVPVPVPPVEERGSKVGLLARVAGAVGLSALAAFFVVGAMPQPLQGSRLFGVAKPEPVQRVTPPAVATERVVVSVQPVAFADRLAAVPVKAEAEPAATARAVQIDPPAAPPPSVAPPSVRALDREEIAMLVKRSEVLITQGDIAAARLMLTRAAEAGNARAALALGATFDPDMLRKLGVLGVAPDAAQARAWYAKAAEYGSGEATRRLELVVQSTR